ncbi:MAG: hypothetical protein AAF212_03865 [Verrucomicrobiota bacterium]
MGEAQDIQGGVRKLLLYYQSGRVEDILRATHESVFPVTGGRDGFRRIAKSTMRATDKLSVDIENMRFESVDRVYRSGSEEVVFMPLSYVIDYGDYRARIKSYFVALKRESQNEWKFIEGFGFRGKRELIWQLLPELSKSAKIPDISIDYE